MHHSAELAHHGLRNVQVGHAELQLDIMGLVVAVSLDRNLEGVVVHLQEVDQDLELVKDVPDGSS